MNGSFRQWRRTAPDPLPPFDLVGLNDSFQNQAAIGIRTLNRQELGLC